MTFYVISISTHLLFTLFFQTEHTVSLFFYTAYIFLERIYILSQNLSEHLSLNIMPVKKKSWILNLFQVLTVTSSAEHLRTTDEISGLQSSGRITSSASSVDTLWRKDLASKNAQVSIALKAGKIEIYQSILIMSAVKALCASTKKLLDMQRKRNLSPGRNNHTCLI